MSVRKIAYNNTNKFYKGDIVLTLSTGYITSAAAASWTSATTTPIAGVFQGCKYFSSAQQKVVWSPYFPGGDTVTGLDVEAYIIDDPNVVFLAQTGGLSGSAIGISAIGNNVQISVSVGSGNTLSGISGYVVDESNVGTTSTYPFRVYDIPNVQTSGGTPGTAAGAIGNGYDPTTKYNFVLVTPNNHELRAPITGI